MIHPSPITLYLTTLTSHPSLMFIGATSSTVKYPLPH